MNSSPPSSKSPGTLLLQIRGVGPITSFKNSKMLSRGRLITSPVKQKQMDQYIHAIESQLLSAFRTTDGEMQMGHSLASWIASCVPLDDSIQWVPEISVKAVSVAKGEEGADILIEKL